MNIDEKRRQTMRRHLGEAIRLIDDERYLPLFRNRQKNYPEEFAKAVEIAKTKKKPSFYFAKIWGKEQLDKSLNMLRKLINTAKHTAITVAHQAKEAIKSIQPRNEAGRRQYEKMRAKMLGKRFSLG